MIETADIVIIGAGNVGACTALQLARRTIARIIVIDQGTTTPACPCGPRMIRSCLSSPRTKRPVSAS